MEDADHDLIDRLYTMYEHALYVYALHLTKNEDDAKDLVQEIFFKLIKNPALIKNVKEDKIKSYLVVSITNQFITNIKKSKKFIHTNMSEFSDELFETDSVAIDKILSKELDFQLSHIPDTYKLIAYLRYIEGKKINEISDDEKIPQGTIGVYLRRIISMLKERFGISDENEKQR